MQESASDIMTRRRRLGEMADRFEKGSFSPDWVDSAGLREAFGPHWAHRERIQKKLREFLSAQEARETATHVYNLALDIDQEIGRILKDPLVRRLYEYDGRFFTPRGTRFFHTAFDGLHLLKWLRDSVLETFFQGREKHSAVRWLLEELGKHDWVAKVRRLNWEESHTLGVLPRDVIEAIIKGAWERAREGAGPPRMSLEEQAFFQSYEEQMGTRG
jgi:hypothetical protein